MSLIRERLKQLRRIDHSVISFIEEKVAREDLQNWGNSPAYEQRMTTSILDIKENPFRSLSGLLP